MTDQRLPRGRTRFLATAGIGLLFAAVSGCGSVVASDSASAPAAAAAAPQVGCASVNQATAVTIRNVPRMMVPVNTKTKTSITYREAAQVRALFGQMCAAVTHPAPNRLMHCPADVGTEFLGTFYDGTRALATFAYTASGCARVSLTAAGKTLSTGVYGPAAAAAPRLAIDLGVIMGTPKPGTMQPQGAVNPGGPNKPA
jgi:uncharacterized protein YceK